MIDNNPPLIDIILNFNYIDFVNGLIWSPALIYLLLFAGLFYTIATRVAQIRHFKEMIRLLLNNSDSDKGISSFQALALSLSGRVGTGNIAGVAAAIGFGGPGAIFWMWIIALLGAATAYVEATLAQIYKEVQDGQYRGGPAYYIEKAMGVRWYAWIFAISTILACGFLLPTVQSNSIGLAINQAFGNGAQIDTALGTLNSSNIITGVVIVFLLSVIIFGGVKRIANVAQVIVPFMALAYIIIACVIVILNITQVPHIISLIVNDAFSPMAGFGAAIGWGVKRGLYSNEAGQGTAPHAAAAAEVEHPAQQGLVQSFSVYIDTLFVCSATAFMILITGAYNVIPEGGTVLIENAIVAGIEANGPGFTQHAIESVLPNLGNPFVAVALFFFAFTTLLAYYYIAESNIAYIRRTVKIPFAMFSMKVGFLIMVFIGTIKEADMVWKLGDIGVGLMAWINIISLLIIFFLARPALKALRDYEQQKKQGVEQYRFKPSKLGIKNASFWENKKQK